MTGVDAINAVVFTTFWVFLFIGSASVLARVAYYRAHGYRRPRLLIRDASMIGGFALSFGLVLGARAARSLGADITGLSLNPLWSLATGLPAVYAVVVFVYFEVFVIERTGSRAGAATDERAGSATLARIETALTENTRITQEGSDHADAAYKEANSVNEKIASQGAVLVTQGEDAVTDRERGARVEQTVDSTAGQVGEIHDVIIPRVRT